MRGRSVNAIFRAVRGGEGMGYGDFKMTAAVAAFLGWRELFMVILLSSFVGLVFGRAQKRGPRHGVAAVCCLAHHARGPSPRVPAARLSFVVALTGGIGSGKSAAGQAH